MKNRTKPNSPQPKEEEATDLSRAAPVKPYVPPPSPPGLVYYVFKEGSPDFPKDRK